MKLKLTIAALFLVTAYCFGYCHGKMDGQKQSFDQLAQNDALPF